MLVLLGHNERWPYYMPDFLPCNTKAGGDEGCRRMMRELADMGMQSVLFYGHPYYNHPQAKDYVEAADTGYDHLNRAWPKIGNVACLDSRAWHALWREKYIPGFARLGAAGVYWDQGPTQYLVCPRTDHPMAPTRSKNWPLTPRVFLSCNRTSVTATRAAGLCPGPRSAAI